MMRRWVMYSTKVFPVFRLNASPTYVRFKSSSSLSKLKLNSGLRHISFPSNKDSTTRQSESSETLGMSVSVVSAKVRKINVKVKNADTQQRIA